MSTPDFTFFLADTGSGKELWRTDGTAAGTVELSAAGASEITVVDGVAYFTLPDGQGDFGPQWELWRSDGTVAGTTALGITDDSPSGPPDVELVSGKTLYIGQNDSQREGLFASSGGQPGVLISTLGLDSTATQSFGFVGPLGALALLESSSSQLWTSDGTAAGTHLLNTGSLAFQSPSPSVAVNGKSFFTAQVGSTSGELIETTDGVNFTPITSSAIVGAGPGISGLFDLGDLLVIRASDGSLIGWDGNSASGVALPALPGQLFLFPTVVGDKLYFTGTDQTSPDFGLWVTDGTVAGTREVAKGEFQTYEQVGSRYVLSGSALGATGLFVSNGTAASTALVLRDVNPLNFVDVGDQVFFTLNTDLWVSNGTVAGTHLVEHFTSFGAPPTALGNDLLFSASTDPSGQGNELWVSDGTAAGTRELVQLHASEPGNLAVSEAVSFGGGVAFVGTTQIGGAQLWISNGTPAGTAVLPAPAPPFSDAAVIGPAPIVVGGVVFFGGGNANGIWAATSGAAAPVQVPLGDRFFLPFDGKLFAVGFGNEFGVSDGTVAGTTQVLTEDVASQPAVLGDEVLFLGNDFNGNAGLFATDGTAAGTSFVAAVPTTVTPSGITVSGTHGFFVATGPDTGAELWVTDGTTAGTHILSDIAPGVGSSAATNLTAFDGGIAFDATDLTHGNQLWFSDGTAGGAFQLDINQTRDATASLDLDHTQAFAFGGKTWFLADDGIHGEQLFSTDGTTAGTVAVATLDPSAPQAPGQPGTPIPDFVALTGGKFMFLADNEAWVSDGTGAGTAPLVSGFDFPQVIGAVDGLAFIVASPDGVGRNDLYVTDGTTAGTQDLGAESLFASEVGFAIQGDDVFYFSSDPTDGYGLFAYNALSHSATFLGQIPTSAAFFTDVGGQLQAGSPNTAAASQVWVTNGTVAGTHMVASTSPVFFSDFTTLAGKGYFDVFGSDPGLWVTDGTAGGTFQVLLNLNIQTQTLTPIGSELYFEVAQSNVTSVWAYNPATQSAAPVAAGNVDSIPFDFTAVGTGGFFIADDHTSQGELWHISSSGTVTEVTSANNGEIQPANGPDNIALAVMGSSLFFAADDATHGESLFISNGTSATFLAQVANANDFSVIGNELYFQGSDAANGAELWESDGTVAGTHRVTDTEAAGNANASDFVTVGGKLFFSANDGVHGQELWAFNGQAGGAAMVADIDAGSASSNPTDLTALNGDVYFIASNASGSELWRSDGTAGGTTALTTASNGASPQDLTLVGSDLFFFGADSAHGSGLFVSNGSSVSFVDAFSAVADLTASNGELFFQGTTANGTELWSSNGTAAGTVQLSSTGFNPGSNPGDFNEVGPGAASPAATASSDFNADGFSDILFGQSSGALATWQMHGTAIVGGGAIGGPGGTWSAVGTGDFNDDNRADVLFQDASGNLATWQMNGTAITGGGAIGNPGGTWSAVGVGDFNGDGLSDILFQDAAHNIATWQMDGTSIIGGGAIGNPGGTWSAVGVGDFDGDGKSDILFEDAGGNFATWQMFGTFIFGGGDIGAPGPTWTYEGIGDFNDDGKSDILFHNTSSGDYAIWEMNGTAIIGGGDIGNPGGTWQFAGIGDYNSDGHADILFTDAAGDLAIWEMNGTQIIGGGEIGNPGSVWHVLG
ncbi:MAG TPA: FG-GAP-like repeat-containing protein [Caulobacteraceae bacterium]|nr:FG-GAP-like repeat-containing protein [Caulobacteraceae bacterium]